MDTRDVPCEVAGKSRNVKCLVERVVLGRVFFHANFVFACYYCSTSTPNLSAFSCCSYQDKRAISGNPQRKQCSFGLRGVLDNHFQNVFNR
jgi:hypothetical protein